MKGNNEPFRDFEMDRDLPAIKRIWQEVGWVSEESEIAQLDQFFACGRTRIATINDVAECAVHVSPGFYNLAGTELELCAVTAVTTSRIARGHAFAKRLTADQLLHAKANGAQMAALGMFDQGFYDQLGFGTGAYDHEFTFDPDLLQVDHRVRTPQRLSQEDAVALNQAMLKRLPAHGGVKLLPDSMFRAELGFHSESFGLGYRTVGGGVSHFVWLDAAGERGPYEVLFMSYENTEQLVELLGLLKSLSDQVYSVVMREPPEIQLQSLLTRPMRHQALTKSSKHMNGIRSLAWWQARILDLPATVSALDCLSKSVRFNLELTDPLDAYAESKADMMGGEYVVQVGVQGLVEEGRETSLPTLNTSINALTRLLTGSATAEQLTISDDFDAPQELLHALSTTLSLPRPVPGIDF